MDKKEAYGIIVKHVFVAYKTYSKDFNPLIILADTKEEAKEKAIKCFNTNFVTICKLKSENENGVYSI